MFLVTGASEKRQLFHVVSGGKERKEEKKGRKRREEREEKKREREEKGKKKGRKTKGKEGKGEYEDSVGGCVGRFFFQSPEVCQKLGCQSEFLKRRLIYENWCDERLKTKNEEGTHLAHTGFTPFHCSSCLL
jgi:hypothetical protein